MVAYVEGILKIANFVLAIIAGYLAWSLIKMSGKRREFKSWRILMIALLLFGVQEVLGALRAFDVWSTPHLTHVVPSILLGFVIWALSTQIHSGRKA